VGVHADWIDDWIEIDDVAAAVCCVCVRFVCVVGVLCIPLTWKSIFQKALKPESDVNRGMSQRLNSGCPRFHGGCPRFPRFPVGVHAFYIKESDRKLSAV
jgi:hypothetical protein